MAVLIAPPDLVACRVFEHGTEAAITQLFMVAMAQGLAEGRVATLRCHSPFVGDGFKRPDSPAPAPAQTNHRVASVEAARQLKGYRSSGWQFVRWPDDIVGTSDEGLGRRVGVRFQLGRPTITPDEAAFSAVADIATLVPSDRRIWALFGHQRRLT